MDKLLYFNNSDFEKQGENTYLTGSKKYQNYEVILQAKWCETNYSRMQGCTEFMITLNSQNVIKKHHIEIGIIWMDEYGYIQYRKKIIIIKNNKNNNNLDWQFFIRNWNKKLHDMQIGFTIKITS